MLLMMYSMASSCMLQVFLVKIFVCEEENRERIEKDGMTCCVGVQTGCATDKDVDV